MGNEILKLEGQLLRQKVALFSILGFLAVLSFLIISSEQSARYATLVKATAKYQPENMPSKTTREPAKDRILVKFAKNLSLSDKKDILQRNELIETEEIGKTGVKIVKIKEDKSPKEVVDTLQKKEKDKIEFAETDDLISPDVIPNDPYFAQAWHLPKIQAPQAWDQTKASGVLIGICDTGILGSHPDLASILRAELGFNTVDNSTNWQPVYDHGSLVAGAASGVVNNAIGIAGVAWGSMIIPVRISNLGDGRAYVSDAAECIVYTAGHGAKAINLSYRMAEFYTIHEAAKEAESLGAVTSVSAGNENTNPSWPDFQSFLAVAATNQLDERVNHPGWWGSNYGTYIDIAAPGENIITTSSDGSYRYASGTSLAAPLVTGAIAMIFGANPSLTVSDVKDILLATTDDLGTAGEDIYYGAGRVNVQKAVSYLLGNPPSPTPAPTIVLTNTPTPTPTLSPTPIPDLTPPTPPSNLARFNNNGVNIPLTWNPSVDNVGVKNYIIYRGGTKYDTDATTLYIDSNTSLGVRYVYYVTAMDDAGNESEPSNSISLVGADKNNGVFFGKVVSASDGSPLTEATVSVRRVTGKQKEVTQALTDGNGDYILNITETNDYEITVTANGFEKKTSSGIYLSPESSIEHNFSLSPLVKGKGKRQASGPGIE